MSSTTTFFSVKRLGPKEVPDHIRPEGITHTKLRTQSVDSNIIPSRYPGFFVTVLNGAKRCADV
jgi:hypothetical protein